MPFLRKCGENKTVRYAMNSVSEYSGMEAA